MKKPALLVLEDGTIFQGISIGASGITIGEIVFNTSMTGYEEILTDPSYNNQIVTFTFPHIGNTGITQEDEESNKIHVKGIIIREISLIPSNYRSKKNLPEYLKDNNIIGIANIDTRKLTKILRNKGTQYGYISTNKNNQFSLQYQDIIKWKSFKTNNLIIKQKTKQIYSWKKEKNFSNINIKYKKKILFHIIIYDFGTKNNILKELIKRECYLTIVSTNTTIENILNLSPDGIILSNGPGDPRSYINDIETIKELLKTDIPIFGICLGHQILALANGAKIIKMKFGHHGSNHPVKELKNNNIMITSQNHNFTIDHNQLPKNIKITHISLFDKTIQGIQIKNKNIFSFQGHPEASPGPHDIKLLFNQFLNNIKNKKK